MAPVPKAAERLRSETLVLLPSQCSCMPGLRALQEDRGEVDDADPLALGDLVEVPVQQRLGRVEGVEAAGAEGRLVVDEVVEAVDDGEQALADHADADEAQRQPVDEVELDAAGVDLGEEAVGAEALVDGGAGEEALEGGEVDGVGRHAGDDQRLAAGAGADAAGVAAGAVEEDAVDAHGVAERGADRAGVVQLRAAGRPGPR